MSFSNPLWLLALLVIPVLAAAAYVMRARQDRYAIRFPAAAALARATEQVRSPLQHAPPLLLGFGLLLLGLALAKPTRTVNVPVEGATVVLVSDHSGSMAASDVLPTRLSAAIAAADRFIKATPKSARVGLVTYSDAVDQAIQPTTDHELIRTGIHAQEAGGSTQTGPALQTALSMLSRQRSANGRRPPSAIVLLSDGKADPNADPIPVAQEAGRLRIPISTVALGTADAVVTARDPNTGQLVEAHVPPDPAAMAQIAQVSGGRAFTAENEDKLASIYESLGSSLATRRTQRDLTRWFALAGLVVLLGAGLASVALSSRVP